MECMNKIIIGIFATLLLTTITPVAIYAATPEQCAALRRVAADIPCDAGTPVSAIDEVLGISSKVANSKQYLLSISSDLRNSCAPPTNTDNIRRLNNTFAVCAAQFLSAYESAYGKGSAVVVSAFRDGAPGSAPDGSGRSANECAGGALNSRHTKGIALDINPGPGGSYETLKRFAEMNSQFGVHFPWFPYQGKIDKPHMDFKGSCPGAPTTSVDFEDTPTRSRILSSGVADLLRGTLGLNTAPTYGFYSQTASDTLVGSLVSKLTNSVTQSSGGNVTTNTTNSGASQSINSSFSTPDSGSIGKISITGINVLTSENTNESTGKIDNTTESGTSTEELLLSLIRNEKQEEDTNEVKRSVIVQNVPLPQRGDSTNAFLDRAASINENTFVSDSGASLTVEVTEPSGQTGVSGFFGSSGETPNSSQRSGVVGRLCNTQPWHRSITAQILSPLYFDSLCVRLGHTPTPNTEYLE